MLDFIGRLHPLILHLPIGFLAIAFMMQLAKKEALKPAIGFTLKWGMIAAIISSASGYFLSQEGGYDENLLFWHKWLGIATAVLSAVIYYLFKTSAKAFFPFFVATIIVLLWAGHYGGSLTHGSGFLLEPFQEKEVKPVIVNVDEAHVYQDFIKPILNEKCNSCHNESKKKGELLMTSEEGILKGGKTGALFVAGNIEKSLMFERIHLEKTEKKHMPPKGKKQLTEDEIKLLEWWVAAGADFEKTVAETETPTEIKTILNKYAEPEKDSGVLALSVSAASENKLKKLRESGFKIYPIAQGSPFLDAVFTKDKILNKSVLKKLKTVSEQIIRLDLSGSKLDDDMVSIIGGLPHLQKLFLQNTSITDNGLKKIADLNYLEYLNLYGTAITDKGLSQMPPLPRLRNIYLWQTKTTEEGIVQLKNKMPYLKIEKGVDIGIFGDATLNPPQIIAEKDMFKDTMSVELKMSFKGAIIFYTLDGSNPDSNSLKYDGKPLLLNTSTEIKAFSKKTNWKSSEVVSRFFPRAKYKIVKVNVSPKPDNRYKANGAATLHDFEKATLNFKDGKWLGYEKSHATITLDLGEKKEISRITLGAMEDTGSYIFFPKGMEVSVSENGSNYRSVVKKTYPTADAPTPPSLANFSETFDPVETRFVKVFVKSNLVNPSWHPAPGVGCWIFLDEVFVE